jgi:stage II sporulation protein M
LLFGIAAYFYLPDAEMTQLQQYLLNQLQTLAEATALAEAVRCIFRANLLDLLRIYLAGICLLGIPLLLLFLFLKGFTFGFSACFLLAHSPLLLLTRLLYVPWLVLAAAFGCRFSLLLVQNRVNSPTRQLLQYTITFGLLLALVFLVSMLDGLGVCYYLRQLVS